MSRIEDLEKRLASDPNSRVFVQLAEEYRKQGQLDQAIEVCEEGLKKHPEYHSARVALGRALLEAKTFDRASEAFETVLAQVPDNILANKFLGETYHRLGRLDEALAKYEIAKTLAPEDAEIDDKIAAVKGALSGGSGGVSVPAASAASGTGTGTGTGAAAAPQATPASPEDQTLIEPPPLPRDTPQAPAPPPPVVPASGVVEPGAHAAPPADQAAFDSVEPIPTIGAESVPEAEEDDSGSGLTSSSADEDLPPIPLAQVDEPMVLEERFANPAAPESGVLEQTPESVPVEPEPEPEPEPELEPGFELERAGEVVFDDAPSAPAEEDPSGATPRVQPEEPYYVPSSEPVFEATPLEPSPAQEAPAESVSPPEIRGGFDAVFESQPEPELEPAPAPAPTLEPEREPELRAEHEPASPTAETGPLVSPASPSPSGPAPARPELRETGGAYAETQTPTMAEIYASQGHFDKAISVYRSLLEKSPGESKFLDRIAELETAATGARRGVSTGPLLSDRDRQRQIQALEQWLDSIRRSRRT
jgi:tetratricopeptide (TPR) repeat protein